MRHKTTKTLTRVASLALTALASRAQLFGDVTAYMQPVLEPTLSRGK